MDKLAAFIQELGRFPVSAELKQKARQDSKFPSRNAFARFGGETQLATRIIAFCQEREGYEDVVAICAPLSSSVESGALREDIEESETFGFVYLLKSGRYYKIGRTNSVGRRERELAIQLPEQAVVIHSIKTDDPAGIESYWHKRFGDSRKNGEWFELSANDVSAFRRRKFM
ncbi:MAG: GIY-YIG nuclease family protein [Actinobacteria bacterium]|nr:GIY-YIG nuclease family protein [Actinomycetota bacterium]MCA1737903.1 GIY-YIG nuclease family protein [Actinomycetota bacterium]